jgi:hypothetical protein
MHGTPQKVGVSSLREALTEAERVLAGYSS